MYGFFYGQHIFFNILLVLVTSNRSQQRLDEYIRQHGEKKKAFKSELKLAPTCEFYCFVCYLFCLLFIFLLFFQYIALFLNAELVLGRICVSHKTPELTQLLFKSSNGRNCMLAHHLAYYARILYIMIVNTAVQKKKKERKKERTPH